MSGGVSDRWGVVRGAARRTAAAALAALPGLVAASGDRR
jgi:hypothetical protein